MNLTHHPTVEGTATTAAATTPAAGVARIRESSLLPYVTGIYVMSLIIATPLASKFVAIGPFVISGATLIFPLSYIWGDVVADVWGYEKARRLCYVGMVCQAIAALATWLVQVCPPAPFWHHQQAYDLILGAAPRITAASLLAYWAGEMANSYVLSVLKYRQAGARGLAQAYRYVASTFVGQFIDSSVFFLVAFAGSIPLPIIATTALTVWAAKVLYEVIALPLSCAVANVLKRTEGVDHIDRPGQTDYTLLKW